MAVHFPKSLLTRFYKALTEFQLRLQLFMYSNFMVSADIIFSLINQRKTNVTNRTVLFMLIVNYVSTAFVNEKKFSFGYLDRSFSFFWGFEVMFLLLLIFYFSKFIWYFWFFKNCWSYLKEFERIWKKKVFVEQVTM